MDALLPRTWHKGPPPHAGWWNCTNAEAPHPMHYDTWRWFDGESWHAGYAKPHDSPAMATVIATGTVTTRAMCDHHWTDYWPADARVPRLNPGHSSCMWKGKMWAWIGGELVCEWPPKQMITSSPAPAAPRLADMATRGWKEAAIAWSVCASVHQQWAKGKDGVFSTRQADFLRHAQEARDALAAMEGGAA